MSELLFKMFKINKLINEYLDDYDNSKLKNELEDVTNDFEKSMKDYLIVNVNRFLNEGEGLGKQIQSVAIGNFHYLSNFYVSKVILKAKKEELTNKKLLIKLISLTLKDIDILVKNFEFTEDIIYTIKIRTLFSCFEVLFHAFGAELDKNIEEFIDSRNLLIQALNDAMNNELIDEIEKESFKRNIEQYKSEIERAKTNNALGIKQLLEILKINDSSYLILPKDFYFDFEEFKKYMQRIIKFGEYKDSKAKEKAMDKILGIFENEGIYDGETAIIPKRDYMINDSSKFKTSFYSFLMSGLISSKDYLQLDKKNKFKDIRNFYIYERTGKFTEALSINHISLLIALENVFISCEEYIDSEGNLFLKKADLVKLFGENFRGEREKLFLNLVRDLSQVIIEIKILHGIKHLSGKKNNEQEISELGTIEGNLMSFKKLTNSDKDYIYKIEMPFLKEVLKKSTRNTMKSIDLIKYTFQQPKNMILADYISNVLFYHSKNYGTTPKKFSVRNVLEQLGLYEEYSNMNSKDCNTYLNRLKNNIEIACKSIRNIEKVEFTKISKTLISDKSCGFTVYINSNLDK